MDDFKKKRILYLDFARGLAILFMFTQHCMIIHEKTAGESTILGLVFILLGTAPAAPVFMVIMGVFLGKSTENLLNTIIRGAKLILLGYILNILRFSIPLLIAGTEDIIYLQDEGPISLLFAVDILQLAGLSIIFTAFLKRFSKNIFVFPVLIAIIALVSPYLWGISENWFMLSLFWGAGKNIYFPFFPWVIYPMLGMYLGKYLLNIDDKKNIIVFLICGVLLLIMGIAAFDYFPAGDYHRSGAAVQMLIIGFVLLWLPLCYWITGRMQDENKILVFFTGWSKRVTEIYCIQWILFGWSILILGANMQSDWIAALAGLAVLIITHYTSKINYIKKLFALAG